MKYDLYFHNDLDGHASAALFLNFLESRGDSIGHYAPLNFDVLPDWQRADFFERHRLFKGTRNPAIVLDFPYHPGTAFWFDHHPTAFLKKEWERGFKKDKAHELAPSYYSCCHLVYDALKKNYRWKPSKHFAELVRWLDVIDAARYRSAKQALLIKEPALQLDAYIDKAKHGSTGAARLVKRIAARPLKAVVADAGVRRALRTIRKEIARNLAYYGKYLQVHGTATVIDLTARKDGTLRFAPYYLVPEARYALRMTRMKPFYRLSVSENPWLSKKGTIHIGKLLKKNYGGGGHHGAGGAQFKTRAEAERAVIDMVRLMNR